jgi:hypothetical protein
VTIDAFSGDTSAPSAGKRPRGVAGGGADTFSGGTPPSGQSPGAAPDPLAGWRAGVRIAPVAAVDPRHTIHAYYTATPEHPDGRRVLVYVSTTREAHQGSLVLLDRMTGEEVVLVRNLTTEDSHRAACQQWVSRGRRAVFHDLRGGEWVVAAVDVATREERVLARGRQLGWGVPEADVVPLYGPHWDPTALRDLELLNVATGEVRTALAAEAVRAAYPEQVAAEFGDRPISIFFPVLSPDLTRVFFKLATPLGGDMRSKQASHRAMLVCYDLVQGRFLFIDRRWGHPAWHPGSRTIVDVPNVLIDSDTGQRRPLTGVPVFPGSHPSWSPDGALYVTDVALERMDGMGGAPGEWGIAVVDVRAQRWVLLHRFDDSRGAESWRRCHPHPVFSPDGRRIYFAVSATPWTQLYVAESAALSP